MLSEILLPVLTPPSVISELQKDSGMEGLKLFLLMMVDLYVMEGCASNGTDILGE